MNKKEILNDIVDIVLKHINWDHEEFNDIDFMSELKKKYVITTKSKVKNKQHE